MKNNALKYKYMVINANGTWIGYDSEERLRYIYLETRQDYPEHNVILFYEDGFFAEDIQTVQDLIDYLTNQ